MTELSEEQTKIAIRNSATAFEFTEGPVLNYISYILNVPIDEIYTQQKVIYQGNLRFDMDGKKYEVELQLCDKKRNLIIPGDINHPTIKQLLEHIGSLVFVIKKLTYKTIISSEYTSSHVKKELKKTEIEFDEGTSTFSIIYSIDGSIFSDSSKSVLGFIIKDMEDLP